MFFELNKNAKILLNTLFLLLFLGGVAWFGTAIYHASQLPIQRVKIEGNFTHLTDTEITQAVLPFVQAGFFAIDVSQLKQRLLELPWVKHVSVLRVWPDMVIIHLTEQKAVAHWLDTHLLNADGDVFDIAGKSLAINLPYLSGQNGQATEILEQYHRMNDMLHQLGLHIKSLDLSKRQAWTIDLDNGMKLKLGRIQPMQALNRFINAYDVIFGSRGSAAEEVDLRYPNGMAVRWNKEKV